MRVGERGLNLIRLGNINGDLLALIKTHIVLVVRGALRLAFLVHKRLFGLLVDDLGLACTAIGRGLQA